jgi:NAD(P)-dependent dehydrogenase (short-subunit alcohol dehydrogenase family)
MQGSTVVITGGNTGIGKETVVGLARQGAHVVFTSRNPEKGTAALADIRERSGSGDVELMALDLAGIASIRAFAADFLDRHTHLDVLIANAGLILSERSVTVDGFETTFGVNHLGHFLLTHLLLERLRASTPARIVVVSSGAHRFPRSGINFDDLQSEHGYRGFRAYGRSKLANIYFARELARRLENTGVTANSLHPGLVATEFGRDRDRTSHRMQSAMGVLLKPVMISPEQGARTSIYLASSPEVAGTTGSYFYKCKGWPNSGRGGDLSTAAQDDEAARRLWAASEELVGTT